MQNNLRPVGFSVLTPVVKNLLIINGLCFLLSVVLEQKFGIDLNRSLGLFNPESTYFKPYQVVTHVFMHGSFTHLLSNMFSLWIYGVILENYWGAKRFLTFYMITAFGAAFLHLGISSYEVYQTKQLVMQFTEHPTLTDFQALISKDWGLVNNETVIDFMKQWQQQPDNDTFKSGSVEIANVLVERKLNVPTVGASGAVFGLMLGAAMLFPNTIIFPLFLPLKFIAIIHGAEELYYGFANNPTDNVAHFAHLGGMLFGFILIKYWNKNKRNTFY